MGALRLNQAVAGAAAGLAAAGVQVVHLTGRGKAEAVRQALPGAAQAGGGGAGPVYQVREYLERMELALAAADLAVQRAGAATVHELACAALPSVLVPLGIGNGEQRLNAAGLVRAGGAVLVEDESFGAWAAQNLADLATSPAELERMAAAAGSVAIRDGAERLADMIERVAR
ncbi:MAG: hypothetical protein LBD51_08980 [Bifidobacteriaceae bacterium]|nr:hypothetical protein [Bifidobacteriaceae bacterium]